MKIAVYLSILIFAFGCSSIKESFKPKTYPCLIGCGNKNLTPPKGYCYYGGKLMLLSEFYKKYH